MSWPGLRTAVLVAATLHAGAATLAGQAGLSVERAGPGRLSAGAGAQATAAFRVRAPAGTAAVLEAQLPAGWRLVVPLAPVDGGEAGIRLLGAAVPRNAAAGTYVLRLRARSGAATAADSVRVDVAERRALELAVERVPRFAVAGEPYTAEFRVTNRGNVRAALRLDAVSGRAWPARLVPATLVLEPGETRPVQVTVTTRGGVGAATHLVRVTARAGADAAVLGSAQARVSLVTRGDRAIPARTAPDAHLTLRARATNGGERGGIPALLSASTPLAAGHFDLFYRGRGAAVPERGEVEQLAVSLRGRRGELRGGDQYWRLSPLTAPGRAGLGAGGHLRFGPAWVEGFTARERLGAAGRTTGGALGFGNARESLSLNVANTPNGAAATLRGRARIGGVLGVDAEYGAGGRARAGNVELVAAARGFRVALRALDADSGFPGDQRGRTLRRAEVAARPVSALRLFGAYERDSRGDTAGVAPAWAAASATTFRAGVGLGGVATLERRVESRAAGPRVREADSWVATATVRTAGVRITGGAQAGSAASGTGAGAPFGREWLRVETRVAGQPVRAGVERRYGSVADTSARRARLGGELALSLRPAPATAVTLTAEASESDWGARPTGVVDARVEQRLPGGHALRLQLRALPWAEVGLRRPTLLLDYEIPLHLPGGRSRGAATVTGRVYDQETGRAIPDALVRVGDRAVLTDGRGRWAVAGLATGSYRVEVDPVSIGVGRVAVRPDALTVRLEGERVRPVEVGVARAGRVVGQVSLADGSGVAGTVIELRNGTDRRSRVTDAEGRFVFTDLQPGRWTLVAQGAGLPPHHVLERGTMELELAAGEEVRSTLRALERRREVKLVAGGDVVLGAPAARGAPVSQPAPPAGRSPSRSPTTAPAPTPTPPAVERPWRIRGESGLTDWPGDEYEVAPGDGGLESIAWLVYRDGSLWPRLWLANRALLPTPDAIQPGMVLIVPPFGPITREERDAARAWARRRGTTGR